MNFLHPNISVNSSIFLFTNSLISAFAVDWLVQLQSTHGSNEHANYPAILALTWDVRAINIATCLNKSLHSHDVDTEIIRDR